MRFRTLVVEDEPKSMEMMLAALSSCGVDVAPASDSRQATALIEQEKFDSIFLDVDLPDEDGIELARRIRQSARNRTTPVVAVSEPTRSTAQAEALSAGATFFVPKPLDVNTLMRLYETVHGRPRPDARNAPRVTLSVAVEVDTGAATAYGTSSNVSESGMLLQAACPLNTGDCVRLAFRLPGQTRPVEVVASVVRSESGGQAGVEFAWMSDEDRRRVGELVERGAAA